MSRIPLAICLAAFAAGAGGPERDDPRARMLARQAEGIRSPEQALAILRAAEGEAQKYGLRPGIRRAAAAVQGSAWVNLGPTTANFEENGGTYHKVDSGRARKIIVHPTNPDIVYFATSGGGVWKTYDAVSTAVTSSSGPTWIPITDTIGSLSIGSLAMNPQNPDSLLLGLGDPFDVQTPGMLSSDDGGATWSNAATLSGSYSLGSTVTATSVRDIVFDPAGAIVLAATDAGVFRSTEGGIGASWSLVKPVGGTATPQSCWSLAWAGPHVWLLTCEDGGDGNTGLLYRSTDDGASFGKVTLPSTNVRRMTLAAAPSALSGSGRGCKNTSRPSSGWRVYLLAENDNNSGATDQQDVYCSDSAGASWVSLQMGSGFATAPTNPTDDQTDLDFMHDQAFYNHMIIMDPANPDTVFVGGNLAMGRSTDAGGSWTVMTDWLPFTLTSQTGGLDTSLDSINYVHADWHAAAIAHSGGTAWFYAGTDGGIFRAVEPSGSAGVLTGSPGNVAWEDKLNRGIVTHLVYSVASDKERAGSACAASASPGNLVFGGLQDNGTRLRELRNGQPNLYVGYNQVEGGDGFGVGMGCSTAGGAAGSELLSTYVGSVSVSDDGGSSFGNPVFDANNGCSSTVCTPAVTPDGSINFRMKMVTDLTAARTYLTPLTDANSGANYVYRSTDGGAHWTSLGGPSTSAPCSTTFPCFAKVTRNVAAHLHTANTYAVVSGGRVFVTTNAGSSWHASGATPLVTTAGTNYLSMTNVAFDPTDSTGNTVWVSSANTFMSDGSTAPTGKFLWKCTSMLSTPSCSAMSNGIPAVVPVNVVKVDPADANTVYAGTEIGMYRSTDGGANFGRYGTGLPLVSVTDIAINADGSAIRVSTFGRGFWEIYPSDSAPPGVAGNGDVDHNGVVDGFDVVREAAILFADRASADYDAMGDTVGGNDLIDANDFNDVVANKLGGP